MSDKKYRHTFTVFTATYNRAHTLRRTYESLKKQTFRDFEWLVVDDGSTDNTRELIEGWSKESDFLIRYFYQENSGKHIATSLAVKEARGEFFLTFDSDDRCVPEALEKFKFYWESIPENSRSKFSGVTGLCQYPNSKLVGQRFPFDPTDSDSREMFYRYKIKGEKWGFQKTDVMKQYACNDLFKKNYIPASLVWFEIAKKYKTRYINEILRTYWVEGPSEVNKVSPLKNAL